MRNYQKLEGWKLSMNLVKEIYGQTKAYPKEEWYGLTSQTRRAAISIPSNIAEGMGRQCKKNTLPFLHIARGPVYELETHLNIALMAEIIDETAFQKFDLLIDKTIQLLSGLISYTEKAVLK